jgi:type 1 glutamine amidotransferase
MQDWFNEDTLKNYSAVIFLNTTGDVLNYRQEAAFERYIQAGGGFVGVHSSADTEYDWGWYGRLIGGYFNGHPPGTQSANLLLKTKILGLLISSQIQCGSILMNYIIIKN